MQRAEKPPEGTSELDTLLVHKAGVRRFAPAEQRGAEEGPAITIGRLSDERRNRDREGQEGGEAGGHRELAPNARERELAPRKAECPPLLDQPHGVVPAFAEQTCRGRVELGELIGQERANERLVDLDLGIPFGHYGNLSPAPGV